MLPRTLVAKPYWWWVSLWLEEEEDMRVYNRVHGPPFRLYTPYVHAPSILLSYTNVSTGKIKLNSGGDTRTEACHENQ